jgi:hypothetical protein
MSLEYMADEFLEGTGDGTGGTLVGDRGDISRLVCFRECLVVERDGQSFAPKFLTGRDFRRQMALHIAFCKEQ